MSYYLYLVETKKEYTTHLKNALAPLIYEGISSIYEDAKKEAPENDELRLFQSLLRKIPSWNEHLIEQETNRILKFSSVTNKDDIIEDLIKAVIKSNIMILTNTPPEKKDNIRIKHDITPAKFIHNSYIEVARNIFQNPFLFYHKCNNYELKKNQRDAIDIIKNSIEQSVRKLLPMNIILQNYLGGTFENQSDDFNNPIPHSDYNNLRNMLTKDPIENNTYQLVKNEENDNENKNNNILPNINIVKNIDENNIGVEITAPKNNHIIESSEHFKSLKELAKNNISPIENKANKIMLSKTKQAIKETEHSTEHKSKRSSHSRVIDINEQKQNKESLKEPSNEIIKHLNISQEGRVVNANEQQELVGGNNKYENKSNENDEDESASYYKLIENNEAVEIYDNTKKGNQIGHESIVSSKKINSREKQTQNEIFKQPSSRLPKKKELEKEKKDEKPFIDYDELLNGNSSVNIKSIMNDLSKDDTEPKINNTNKKKYFNKNGNL